MEQNKRNSCLKNGTKNWRRQEYVDIKFAETIDEIKLARVNNGKDDIKNPKSFRRITKALRNITEWEEIKKRLINAEMQEDRWKDEDAE